MQSALLLYQFSQPVCLSVSDTPVAYHIKVAERFIKINLPSDSPIIVFFWALIILTNFRCYHS